MTGPFNTIGHETEEMSRLATTELLTAISTFFTMLGALEERQLNSAEQHRSDTISGLQASAEQFKGIAGVASDYLLESPPTGPSAGELNELYSRLANFNYTVPLRNNQLPQIAMQEIRRFEDAVRNAQFHGSEEDWNTFKETIEAANRLLSIGLATARISALTRH